MDPKIGAQTPPFFCARRPWEPKWLPRPPPRVPKTSPSLDFHRFWVDFGRLFDDFLYHVGYFLSGLPLYFFGYLELSFSNVWPQVQMCWGRPQGSIRSQKSAMWPTFCLACLFVLLPRALLFKFLAIDFSGSSVELLANCGRRHGGGNAEGKWIIGFKALGDYLNQFWSNKVSVLLCEGPKPPNCMIY